MDVEEVLDKGLEDESGLSEVELQVFSVAYLESVADMEGWDHFYTYSMHLHPIMTSLLLSAEDRASLKVIQDYEKHFSELGVAFNVKEIDAFLSSASESYYSSCPDWREEFSLLSDQRWDKIVSYLNGQGIKLKA